MKQDHRKRGIDQARLLRRRAQGERGGPRSAHEPCSVCPPGSLGAHLQRYLETLAVKQYSEMTICNRRVSLEHFIAWAADRDLVKPVQITRPILESYQRWLHHYRKKNGKPLGVRTQIERLRSVQDYFRWLCRQNLLLSNPASELELPRTGRRLPVEALSLREVERILAVPDLADPLGIRDRAILEVFYSTGMRRMELVNLQLGNVNAERGTIAIREGKGRKDRIVPIGKRALSWVERYLDRVRPLLEIHTTERALFLSSYGEAFNRDVLGRMVSAYIKRGCPGRKGGCHLFRHTCATHMLENGADTRFIQQLLGHASLETTQIYTQVSIKQLQEVHARTHPAH